VHQAILNRVLCADGTWRALDGQALFLHKAGAGAIAERVMEAYLARVLGVRFETRPDGKAREVVGIGQDVRDLFSSRRHAITAKAEQLVAAFREQFDRAPSPLEHTRLSQQATLATRKAKSHDGETLGDRLDRWARECHAAVAKSLAQIARDVLDLAQRADPPAEWSERDVLERALSTVAKGQQSWTRSDLMRAVSDELPGHLDVASGDVRELLEGLADRALAFAVRLTPEHEDTNLPAHLRLANDQSVFARPGEVRYATHGQLTAEAAVRAGAVRRGAATFTAAEADAVITRFAESGVELGADQAAALRGILTSGAQVEVLSAAAGTGKSFTVAALAETWTGAGRRVFGLASSQVAAQVLAEEGVTVRNTAAWLTTQARLDRVTPGAPDPGGDGGRLRQWKHALRRVR